MFPSWNEWFFTTKYNRFAAFSFLLHGGMYLLTSEGLVDGRDAAVERIVLLHAEDVALAGEAQAADEVAAFLVRQHVHTLRPVGSNETLVVVVVQKVEGGCIAFHDL